MLKEMESLVSQGGFQKLQYLQQQDEYFALQKQKVKFKSKKTALN